ncbi:MAG: two-component system, NtrC family, response regulator GlrR [Thermoplasmata archaeon]|jgi:DNA-binding response OmpR family regulator|nr:two-component system, NtrC family, response regulator GlrR [Thermoplasmata archaeon]
MTEPLEPFGVAELVHPEPQAEATAATHAGRVLVVDDDEDIRDALVDAFTAMLPGFQVRAADSGAGALRLAHEGRFDVLVTDYRLPDMDGLALAHDLRARGRCRAAFLVTAFGDRALADEAGAVGVHVVHKPFDVAALSRRVQRAAERARPATPGLPRRA